MLNTSQNIAKIYRKKIGPQPQPAEESIVNDEIDEEDVNTL